MITHAAQVSAQGPLSDRNAELLKNPLAEIDDSPAYDTCTAGTDRHHPAARVVQTAYGRSALAAMGVELHDPVADNLQRYTNDLCSF